MPISVNQSDEGLTFTQSAGGLATGLASFKQSHDSQWVGWPGISSDDLDDDSAKQLEADLRNRGLIPVDLCDQDIDEYYYGFSNKTLWPLFHYFPLRTVTEPVYWQRYEKVNRAFCDAVLEIAEPEDSIWVHDYQLMLVPNMLRQSLPEANIGFFLHIPFPSYELFRLLPWRKELIEGLLGSDLVGFHTYDYVRHFLSSATRLKAIEHSMGTLHFNGRIVRADAFPMGIDYEKYSSISKTDEVADHVKEIREQVGDRKIIISIDRLDYTKGIIERLEAFDWFLSTNEEYREKVTMIILAVPSRTGVDEYQLLREHLEGLIGRVNGEHGTIGWTPVLYLYKSVPIERLIGLYKIADVALITPMRDGMNLIAKEFIAAKTDGSGVLVLSEMAGAASELAEALIVNANSKAEIVEGIKSALQMSPEQQKQRNKVMQKRLSRYTVKRWAHDFMESLSMVENMQKELEVGALSKEGALEIVESYKQAENKLLLLDYDGTLAEFASRPDWADPDTELIELFHNLSVDKKTEVVILSGRDRESLDKWLGSHDISLVAEHGGWIKRRGKKWQNTSQIDHDWKENIRSILELAVDRTPGSFLEEKDFSLVWHYRKSSPELKLRRLEELRETITNYAGNMGIGLFEGSEVLEVKRFEVNKARAAENFLQEKIWDFILAVGDDNTDEEMFAVLPSNSYTIKVGKELSKARYSVSSLKMVRELLGQLLK